MNDTPFPDTPRVDASDKVRGKALFAADDARPGLVHAALAVATIGRGRVLKLDTRAANALLGVRLVLTHEDFAGVKSAGFLMGGGYAFQSFQPMLSAAVAYRGQPIALVAADTIEDAIEGASLIEATCETEPFSVSVFAPTPSTPLVKVSALPTVTLPLRFAPAALLSPRPLKNAKAGIVCGAAPLKTTVLVALAVQLLPVTLGLKVLATPTLPLPRVIATARLPLIVRLL